MQDFIRDIVGIHNFQKEFYRGKSFSLHYGQDAVLPVEEVLPSLRVSRKNGLTP